MPGRDGGAFYATVFLFIRTMVVKIFRYERGKALPVIFGFFICFTSLCYFEEHEDFLWFCASVIYLIPMIFILAGCVCMVYALETKKKRFMILSMLLGFFGGGAVLNIAAFGCILFVMTAYWGIVVKRQMKNAMIMCAPMLIGGLTNVIAPGNFVRKGGLENGEVLGAVVGTVEYVWERLKMFLFQFPLSTVVFIALFIFILCIPIGEQTYKFYVPVIFTAAMFVEVCIVIYSVVLGYGLDVYPLMDRSNYISDFVIFFNVFLTIFYWRGWLAVRFRLCSELIHGEISAYADWNVSVIEAIERGLKESEEKGVIEISTIPMEDKTCLENPKLTYGYYDPEETWANTSMARFYRVDAVYIYEE